MTITMFVRVCVLVCVYVRVCVGDVIIRFFLYIKKTTALKLSSSYENRFLKAEIVP